MKKNAAANKQMETDEMNGEMDGIPEQAENEMQADDGTERHEQSMLKSKVAGGNKAKKPAKPKSPRSIADLKALAKKAGSSIKKPKIAGMY